MSYIGVNEDDIYSVMKRLEEKIVAEINCVAIGKIETVKYDEQTVEVLIVYKRLLNNGDVQSYPLLLDVPFFVLQGGGSFIEMPITKGDFCIVLFNDRNYSTWWDSGNEREPENARKHSLSDGIALAGINPKTKVFDLDGEKVRIKTDKPLVFEGNEVNINGKEKHFVRFEDLNTALGNFMTALNTHTHGNGNQGSPTTPPVAPLQFDISGAKTYTVKTG